MKILLLVSLVLLYVNLSASQNPGKGWPGKDVSPGDGGTDAPVGKRQKSPTNPGSPSEKPGKPSGGKPGKGREKPKRKPRIKKPKRKPEKRKVNNENSKRKIKYQYIIVMKEGIDIKGKLKSILGPKPEFLKDLSFPEGYVGVTTRVRNQERLEKIVMELPDVEFVEADSMLSGTQKRGRGTRRPNHGKKTTTTETSFETTLDLTTAQIRNEDVTPDSSSTQIWNEDVTSDSTNQTEPGAESQICFVQRGAPANLVRISERQVSSSRTFMFPTNGSNAAIYVLDSGVNLQHEEFEGRAHFIDSGVDGIDNPDVDVLGHGTHVAGIAAGKIYGVSKGADVFSVKVLDDQGSGSVSDIVEGLNRVLKHHRDRGAGAKSVVNLSVGGEGYAPSLELAIRGLHMEGIPVVVAAGNNAVNACSTIPSHAYEAISVGCVDNDDVMCSFSNWGLCVDLFAPGKGIKAADADGDSGFTVKDGTSMSAPHVAGIVANLLSSPNTFASADEIVDYILDTTTEDLISLPSEAAESPNRLLFAACENTQTSDTRDYLPPGAADDSSAHVAPHAVTWLLSILLLVVV